MYLYVYECPQGIITATKRTVLITYNTSTKITFDTDICKIIEYDSYVIVYRHEFSAYVIHKKDGSNKIYQYFVHIIYDHNLYIWANLLGPYGTLYKLTINCDSSHNIHPVINNYLSGGQWTLGHNNISVVPLMPLVNYLSADRQEYLSDYTEYGKEIWTIYKYGPRAIYRGFEDIHFGF